MIEWALSALAAVVFMGAMALAIVWITGTREDEGVEAADDPE